MKTAVVLLSGLVVLLAALLIGVGIDLRRRNQQLSACEAREMRAYLAQAKAVAALNAAAPSAPAR